MNLYMILIIFVILFLSFLLKLWFSFKNFKEMGLKSLTLGGYLRSIVKCIFGLISVQEHFGEQSHPFKGQRFVGAFELSGTLLMARSPEAIKMVCIEKSGIFLNHKPMLDVDRDPLFGRMVFFMCDETWKEMRSDLSTAFSGKKLRVMFELISNYAKTSMRRLTATLTKKESQDVVKINIFDMTSAFTLGFFCKSIFNSDLKETVDQIKKVCKRTSATSGFGLLKLAFLRNLPAFLKFQSVQIIQPDDVTYFRESLSNCLKWRSEKNACIPDLMQALCESKKGWTIDDQSAQLLQTSITFASVIPGLLESTMYELKHNPDVYQKLKDEIDEVDLQTNGNLTMDDLNNMDYLDMVISETLRKWPAASITDRVCTQDTDVALSDDDSSRLLKIKKGQTVLIHIYSIHNDPEYWPDPRKFDPNRFSKEMKATIRPYTFIPFGVGTRICPGYRQALIILKLFVYHFMLNFNLSPGQRISQREYIETLDLVTKVGGGTWLDVEQRIN